MQRLGRLWRRRVMLILSKLIGALGVVLVLIYYSYGVSRQIHTCENNRLTSYSTTGFETPV